MKSLERLATLSRQHSTMLDICRAMYSEKSRAFGRGFRATTTKTIQKIWYDKTECDRGKIIVFEAVSEREYLFHESERKVKAGKGYFKNDST